MPKKISREDAIKQYGLHYQPGLGDLDLNLHPPRTLAEKIAHLAERAVPNTITVVETLGPATEDFHFRTIEEAAAALAAEKRAELEDRRDTLNGLMLRSLLENEAAAEAGKPVPHNSSLSPVFEKATATLDKIDEVLASDFTVNVKKLKDQITLPGRILDVGDTVYVLRKTDSLPVLTTEAVAAREMRPGLPFAGANDVSVNYVFGKDGKAAPEKNGNTFVFAAEDDGKHVKGIVGAGANILAFARAADAKAALRDIVKEKIEQLDAERQSLVNILRHEGLSPRRKPHGPKN